jgi:hypothetical protein
VPNTATFTSFASRWGGLIVCWKLRGLKINPASRLVRSLPFCRNPSESRSKSHWQFDVTAKCQGFPKALWCLRYLGTRKRIQVQNSETLKSVGLSRSNLKKNHHGKMICALIFLIKKILVSFYLWNKGVAEREFYTCRRLLFFNWSSPPPGGSRHRHPTLSGLPQKVTTPEFLKTFPSNWLVRHGSFLVFKLCMIALNPACRLTTKIQFHTNLEMRSASSHPILAFLFQIITLATNIRVMWYSCRPFTFCFVFRLPHTWHYYMPPANFQYNTPTSSQASLTTRFCINLTNTASTTYKVYVFLSYLAVVLFSSYSMPLTCTAYIIIGINCFTINYSNPTCLVYLTQIEDKNLLKAYSQSWEARRHGRKRKSCHIVPANLSRVIHNGIT